MIEEGDKCCECNTGVMGYVLQEPCSCHINPPCPACVDAPLVCSDCGHHAEKSEPVKHDIGYSFQPLMLTMIAPKGKRGRIQYEYKPHTHFSMIKVGTYEDGVTLKEVEEEVRGTFGGRFASFGNGRFKYVAYTD